MLPQLAPLADIFNTNNYLFQATFKDLNDGDDSVRPNDKANSLQFIAGHVTGSRYLLGHLLGLEVKYVWAELFNRGARFDPKTDYPAVENLIALWNDITSEVTERLENITEQELAAKAPFKFPVRDETLLGAVAFLALHESYHMGQLSYVRRLLGYDGLAG